MAKFINIDIIVDGIHASANPHVIGLPGLPAIDGFIHNIEREVDLETLSWSMAWRQFKTIPGRIKTVNCETGTNNFKNPSTPSSVPDKRQSTIDGTLIIEVESSSHEELKEKVEKIDEMIEGMRFAGGTISLGRGGVKTWDCVDEALKSVRRMNSSPAFLMEDKTHELADFKGQDRMDRLFDLIARPVEYQKEATVFAYGDEFMGFMTPMVKGYQLLETPRSRNPVREDVPHAFAETMIGVVRLRSLDSVLAYLDEHQSTPPLFWMNDVDDTNDNWIWEVNAHSIDL